MRKLLLLVFCCIPFVGFNQSFTNVMIDEGNAANGPEEPSIAVSLTDSNEIVAGANINTTYRSKDGGKTWIKSKMKSKYGVWGDPCIISTTTGKFMYFHLPLGPNLINMEVQILQIKV